MVCFFSEQITCIGLSMLSPTCNWVEQITWVVIDCTFLIKVFTVVDPRPPNKQQEPVLSDWFSWEHTLWSQPYIMFLGRNDDSIKELGVCNHGLAKLPSPCGWYSATRIVLANTLTRIKFTCSLLLLKWS